MDDRHIWRCRGGGRRGRRQARLTRPSWFRSKQAGWIWEPEDLGGVGGPKREMFGGDPSTTITGALLLWGRTCSVQGQSSGAWYAALLAFHHAYYRVQSTLIKETHRTPEDMDGYGRPRCFVTLRCRRATGAGLGYFGMGVECHAELADGRQVYKVAGRRYPESFGLLGMSSAPLEPGGNRVMQG